MFVCVFSVLKRAAFSHSRSLEHAPQVTVELSAEAHCREQWAAPTWIRGKGMERPERLCMAEERKVLGFGREHALEKEMGL